MIKKKIIKKSELDFPIEKIKGIEKVDLFSDHIEINFEVEE